MDNVYEGEFLDINIIDENIIFSRIKIPIMESYSDFLQLLYRHNAIKFLIHKEHYVYLLVIYKIFHFYFLVIKFEY